MVCFTHISHKNQNREKTETSVFCAKPNRKWNRRTVTALVNNFLLIYFITMQNLVIASQAYFTLTRVLTASIRGKRLVPTFTIVRSHWRE